MFKRALLSVRRRKEKNLIMFLFLFIISTLALTAISIKNATNESMNLVKKSLGGEVTLSSDMEKLREEFMREPPSDNEDNKSSDSSESSEDKKEQMKNMHNKMDESNATIEDVKKISSIKYVSDIKYSFSVDAVEESFTLYSSSSDDEYKDDKMPGMNRNSLEVEAINTFNLLSDYTDGKIELTSGEAFSEEDENVSIISYELATENNLSVGDEIALKDSSDNSHTLKIIGIYQNKSNGGFDNNYNKIYIDIASGESFMDEETYNDGNYKIKEAVFYLNDPEKVDEFKEEANKLVTDLEDRYLKLDIDTNSYDRMTSALKGASTFANIVLIVVVIASIIVISLMVINSLKDRNYELGVLLSLGEKKLKIIGQFIVELLIICLMSFILSIGTSKLISQKLGDKVVSMQTESSNENKMEFGGRGSGLTNRMNDSEVIDEVDVNVNGKNISMLFMIELGIIVVSMIVPSIKILNSDPKDILSRRE